MTASAAGRVRVRLDLLLDGLAPLITDGRAAAAPTLQRAANAFAAASPAEDVLRWGWLTTVASERRLGR